MDICIAMPNGSSLSLQPHQPVHLGRSHYQQPITAPFVARKQCTATLCPDGGVEVVSVAKDNPTLIVFQHNPRNTASQRVLLHQDARVDNVALDTQPNVVIAKPSATASPLMLIMVGLPGSGKSTFAEHLVQHSQGRRWTRINQQGSSVIIDRCNQSPAQRSTFVQLAKELGVAPHIVALILPLKLVLARATSRAHHEGGVQGPGAARVVHMMNKELQEHAVINADAEAVQSCVVCTNEAQVDAALAVWCAAPTGPSEGWDPAALVAAAAPAARRPTQPTLHSFFGTGTSSSGPRYPAATSAAGPAHPPKVASNSRNDWHTALQRVALHPEAHPKVVIRVTEHSVLMLDGFPKARHHALVLARDPLLVEPRDLRRKHLHILYDMLLHLHAISTDLVSERIKHKKHWNSFATTFFLPIDTVLEQLQRDGRLTIDTAAAEGLLTTPLCCHRCRMQQPTLPALKRHLGSCTAPLPGAAAGAAADDDAEQHIVAAQG